MRNTVFTNHPYLVMSQVIENSTIRFRTNFSCKESNKLGNGQIENMKCPMFMKRIADKFRMPIKDPFSMKTDCMVEENVQENCPTKDCMTTSEASQDRTERDIICMKSKLEFELFCSLGPQRYCSFVKDFVRHWDITILASRDDYKFALQSRDALLRTIRGVTVTGPWDLQRGDKTLDRWSVMLSRCQVVLVLVSKAFLQDRVLSMCCSEVIVSRAKRLIPIHLEKMNNRDFNELQNLTMFNGVNAHTQGADDVIRKLVPWLPKQMAIKRHLDEIDILLSQSNLSYLDDC